MATIDERLKELIDQAREEKDSNTLIVLLILAASRESGDSDLLARKVQEYAKDVLMPRAVEKKNQAENSKN
jgi:hypothetical protein